MDAIDLTDWYRALTLAERTALADLPALPPVNGDQDGDEHARRRIEEWRALTAFKSGPWRERHLEDLGLTEESFERLVALLPDRLGAPPPAWMAEISDRRSPDDAALPPPPLAADGSSAAGFRGLARPLSGRARLRRRDAPAAIGAKAAAPPPSPGESVLQMASAPLPSRILPLLSRTLVLELNVARLQELLTGATPEERFASFVG